jgi:hypothetical protein
MSDLGPDETDAPSAGPIDYSGQGIPKLSDQREQGFQIMKAHMLNEIQKQLKHVPPLTRGTAMHWYAKALEDSFNVFRQITDTSTDEELTPG